MIEEIKNNNILYSIIIRSSYSNEGISFFSPNEYSQQLGYMKRAAGYVIPPHVHNIVAREIKLTQEVLYIKNGKVRVDYYDTDKKYLLSKILNKGDVVLLADGGHGFEILDDAEIIEIKQGPYCGELDKVKFDQVKKERLNIIE
jgi:hypothetical protein